MPSNKNALTRYKYLDEMLSNKHHYYTIQELTDKCNEKLLEAGHPIVSKRCIEKDIIFLEYAPFFAEIERLKIDGKNIVKYSDPTFSIFKKKMTEEESNLILEVLNTIGQFDGLDNFEWLRDLKAGLGLKERPKVISFNYNPYLQNSNLLGILFDYISNQVVIELEYHTFRNHETKKVILHPYLLKQYNERWFLIGGADVTERVLNFPLDRIDNITPMPEKAFVPCREDFTERFDDIVGVSLYEDRQLEHIVFWVSNTSKDYVLTKPIHGSQRIIKGEELELLQNKYASLGEGSFLSIDCIPNYELTRLLSSFGKELVVISPLSIQDEVFTRAKEMFETYCKART
jgi:predicted DNA-binding transcriptional regulator YafY